MEFDVSRLVSTLVQGSSFVAAFAAITAGIIMFQVTKKFGTGILASGFKSISIGVVFIAIGIIIDAFASYIQIATQTTLPDAVLLVKVLFFVVGTYIIVIGSKKTGDKLEALTKPQVMDGPAPKADHKVEGVKKPTPAVQTPPPAPTPAPASL